MALEYPLNRRSTLSSGRFSEYSQLSNLGIRQFAFHLTSSATLTKRNVYEKLGADVHEQMFQSGGQSESNHQCLVPKHARQSESDIRYEKLPQLCRIVLAGLSIKQTLTGASPKSLGVEKEYFYGHFWDGEQNLKTDIRIPITLPDNA
ncbi:hypothetical protein TNCV_1466451 [Trichonephila clavipes]|nr:hypothetical protein TNCV_1466451 [Trichonephila clavipes]